MWFKNKIKNINKKKIKKKKQKMGGEEHDLSYYAKCMMGGILACGLTHTAICPLDVVKCRR